jgi:hypothetical protein
MRLKVRLMSQHEEHQQRWTIGPNGQPRAITASVLCLRFEAIQGENPDKVPTDPIACFEIHAANRELFQHLNLAGQDFFLELWQGVRPLVQTQQAQGKVLPAIPAGGVKNGSPE